MSPIDISFTQADKNPGREGTTTNAQNECCGSRNVAASKTAEEQVVDITINRHTSATLLSDYPHGKQQR